MRVELEPDGACWRVVIYSDKLPGGRSVVGTAQDDGNGAFTLFVCRISPDGETIGEPLSVSLPAASVEDLRERIAKRLEHLVSGGEDRLTHETMARLTSNVLRNQAILAHNAKAMAGHLAGLGEGLAHFMSEYVKADGYDEFLETLTKQALAKARAFDLLHALQASAEVSDEESDGAEESATRH